MHQSNIRNFGRALAVLTPLAILGAASPAQAADGSGCRASASRTELVGQVASEPTRANAPNTPCVTQSAETLHPTTVGPADADAAEAYTSAGVKSAGSLAGASKPHALLGSADIAAADVQASASATCTGATPVLTSAGKVSGLVVNGQAFEAPQDGGPATVPISGGGSVSFNRVIRSGDEITRRAVDVTIPGVGETILAEARASMDAATCAASSGSGGSGGSGGSSGSGGSGSSDVPCPKGSSFDSSRGECVIRTDSDGSTSGGGTNSGSTKSGTAKGSGTIVVAKPFSGPTGGSVIPLATARKRYKSPCLSGGGPKFVILGTKHRDHVTGRNVADRILTFGGNDIADGGRGNDCVDGGSGHDVVAGDLGNDRLYGGSGPDRVLGNSGNDRMSGGSGADRLTGSNGNDKIHGGASRDRIAGEAGNDVIYGDGGNDRLLGGAGADRIHGGSGNDAIFAGYGADRVWGNSGNDLLDTSIFGPSARMVDGGSGRDRARVNPGEVRHERHLERVKVVR